ncbi:aminoacyltransferase, partial [Candidatus Peribacteria bacterium]|nr:aminoacyltransferase [Candidatus Peribacteria bacterium]
MASNQATWDAFLATQTFSPFLQSWTMGEVYRDTGQEPMRLEIREGNTLIGICQAIIVPARRGRHLAIPYGPVGIDSTRTEAWHALMAALQKTAREQKCT